MKKYLLLSSAIFLMSLPLVGQTYEPRWESLDKRETPLWWQDAKFGIFVFWGIYSVPAYAPTSSDNVYIKYAEHYMNRLYQGNSEFVRHHERYYGKDFRYEDFARDFKARSFNASDWVSLFERSGARYVVLTSKHHDGYCLWPSRYAPRWNSAVTGPGRDLLGEFSTAMEKSSMALGLYYSLLEWNHPLYADATLDLWVNQLMMPQMKELIERYKPRIFYTDGDWDFTSDRLRSEEFLAWLYNESPVKNDVVVNDRWGKETRGHHGGYYTTEYDLVHDDVAGQYAHPWEECRGIGSSFGYNQFENIWDYSSAAELIKILVEKVSAGGNLLLDVGPTSEGLIPVVMQERLLEMGDWLSVNGEAIYGSRKLPLPVRNQQDGIYYTVKGHDLYVICTDWKDVISIDIQGLGRPGNVQMLGCPQKVSVSGKAGSLRIVAPRLNPATLPCNHAWVYKLSGCL